MCLRKRRNDNAGLIKSQHLSALACSYVDCAKRAQVHDIGVGPACRAQYAVVDGGKA
jgi:hypothetical protein